MVSTPIFGAHLRVARPTNDLELLCKFYCDGVGFAVVGAFQNHNGVDGLMLGLESAGYHLEFTRKHDHQVGKSPT